jgi:hypothetical protein
VAGQLMNSKDLEESGGGLTVVLSRHLPEETDEIY